VTEFDETLLTVKEIAALLKVPVSWVYQRTRTRGKAQLPHFKLGKYLRFERQSILAWLGEQRSETDEPHDRGINER